MTEPGRSGRELGHAAQGAFVILAILFGAFMFAVGVYVGQNSEPAVEETAEVAQETGAGTQTTADVGESDEETEAESEGEAGDTSEDEGEDEGEGEGEGEGASADGEQVFASAGCGNCHTLEEAGASGSIGPSLDDTDLDREAIEETVRNGRGGMPAFEGNLEDAEIEAVADFVDESSG